MINDIWVRGGLFSVKYHQFFTLNIYILYIQYFKIMTLRMIGKLLS